MNNTITNPLEGSLFTLEELEKVRRTGKDKNLPSKGTDEMYVVNNPYTLTHRLASVRHHTLICYRPRNREQSYTVLDCYDKITSDLLQKGDQCAFWYKSASSNVENIGWTSSWLNPEAAELYLIPVCDQVSAELLETLRAAPWSELMAMWSWVKRKGDAGFPTSEEVVKFMKAFRIEEDARWVKIRTALRDLLLATKIPDGWVADCLRPVSDVGDLTDTEVLVERGENSYDLAHLSAEEYEKRHQLYAVELGDEFPRLAFLAMKRVSGHPADYDEYVAEHGLFKTNAHVKLLEQEGIYLPGTPNLSIYGPAVSPGYPDPFCGLNPSNPASPPSRDTIEAYWKELETSGYVKVRYYLEEEDVNRYFDCPTSKLVVWVPHD